MTDHNQPQPDISQIVQEAQAAKLELDGILSTVRTNNDALRLAKEESERLRAATNADVKVAQDELAQIKAENQQLKKRISDAAALQGKYDTSLTEIKNSQSAISAQKATIDQDLTKIAEVKASYETQKSATDQIQTDLTAEQNNSKQKASEIIGLHTDMKKLHTEMLEDVTLEEGKTKNSFKTKMSELFKKYTSDTEEIKKFKEETEQDFVELKDELTDKINSLLPSAGAAGLAWAYYEAKKRYGFDGNKTIKGFWNKVADCVFNATNWKALFNYILFIVPIGFMFYTFKDFGRDAQGNLNLEALVQGENFYRILLFKLTITVPLAFISWFGYSSIALNRRLYEEYNHKQRVMELFHSFKEQVDNQEDEELMTKLLDIMLDVVKDKPSLAMTSYDKHPLSKLIPGSSEANDNSTNSSFMQPVKNIIKDAKEIVTGS